MLENAVYTINSLKYDGTVHRSWTAQVIGETPELICFRGIFDREINHPDLGVIGRGTISYEFYWKNRWYNVFRFHRLDGALRNFYCNINQPPAIENFTLSYVDLDIDVLVSPDLSVEILDSDEYERNAVLYSYSADLRARVGESLDEILKLVENKSFPFDYAA